MKLTSPNSFLRILSALLCITVSFISCQKMDTDVTGRRLIQKDFFGLQANAPAPLHRIAQELKRQNELTGFIKEITTQNGIPRWDKAIIDTRPTKPTYFANRFDGGAFENDTLVMLPLVLEDTNYVNAFIMARVDDSVILDMYRLNDYDLFPYGDPDADTLTAERVALTFLFLDNHVFGKRKYRIIDDSLFRPRPGMGKNPGELKRTIEYTNKDSVLYPGRLLAIVCTTTANCWCFRDGNECDGNHPCMNGNCDHCYYCVDVDCTTVSIPTNPGGWPPGGSTGGTGGNTGGSGGSMPGNPGNCTGTTCYTGTMLLMGRLPCGGCGEPPIIVIPPIQDTLPCNPYMTALEHNATFISKFSELNTSQTLQAVHEKGFSVRLSDNLYVSQDGNNNQQSIQWNLFGPIDGLLHSHYADLNSIFSLGDVVFMAQIYLSPYARDTANLFFGVTSSYGPPMIMKVRNTTEFRNFAIKIAGANGNDFKRQEKFINKYSGKFTSLNSDTNEIDFLKMLKAENALGAITLYRGNSTLTKWTELTIDNLNNVSSVPCITSQE